MRKITDDEIAFFDENGFVIVKGVLHAEELANFQREATRTSGVAGDPKGFPTTSPIFTPTPTTSPCAYSRTHLLATC